MIVGIQGVQGSGKTTLVTRLCRAHPNRYAAISIDDFYLPKRELDSVLPATPEYAYRGNPGTHEIEALVQVLHDFRRGRPCRVPVYDKTCHAGRGDRVGSRDLPSHAPVLLVEGWCLGFTSSSQSSSSIVDRHVASYERIHRCFDAMVLLQPPSLDIVYEWRKEAETHLAPADLQRFLDMYMPTYKTYLPTLYASPPVRPVLFLQLDAERRLVSSSSDLPTEDDSIRKVFYDCRAALMGGREE